MTPEPIDSTSPDDDSVETRVETRVAGEQTCQEPVPSVPDSNLEAVFVEPDRLRAGQTATVRMNDEIVADAVGRDVETEVFGADYLFLRCWDGEAWVSVWLIRIPGFSDAGPSHTMDAGTGVQGVAIEQPYAVEVSIPSSLPPGTYMWEQSVSVKADPRPEWFNIVQIVIVLP